MEGGPVQLTHYHDVIAPLEINTGLNYKPLTKIGG